MFYRTVFFLHLWNWVMFCLLPGEKSFISCVKLTEKTFLFFHVKQSERNVFTISKKKVFIQFYTENLYFSRFFISVKMKKIEFFFMDVKKKWRERCFKHMLTLRLIKCDFISSFRPQPDFGSPVLPVETDWHVLTHEALLLINSSWIWRVSPGWTRPWEESIFPGWVRQQESRVSVWIILFT